MAYLSDIPKDVYLHLTGLYLNPGHMCLAEGKDLRDIVWAVGTRMPPRIVHLVPDQEQGHLSWDRITNRTLQRLYQSSKATLVNKDHNMSGLMLAITV